MKDYHNQYSHLRHKHIRKNMKMTHNENQPQRVYPQSVANSRGKGGAIKLGAATLFATVLTGGGVWVGSYMGNNTKTPAVTNQVKAGTTETTLTQEDADKLNAADANHDGTMDCTEYKASGISEELANKFASLPRHKVTWRKQTGFCASIKAVKVLPPSH